MSIHVVDPFQFVQPGWRRDAARVAISTLAVLLLPLVAMQLTSEVNWTPLDFLVAAVLLSVTGFVFLRMRHRRGSLCLRLLVLGVAALVWVELAVGVFFGIGS